MIKLLNPHQVKLLGNLVTPGLLVKVKRLTTHKKLKVHTNTVYALVKKLIPMQCYNCTECNSTFDARKKLKKSTIEQHKGKFVISTERKSPITEYKTNIKKYNSNKEGQATADGVEINVMIVTKDIKNK